MVAPILNSTTLDLRRQAAELAIRLQELGIDPPN